MMTTGRGREGTELNIWWVVKVIRRLCHSTFSKDFAASLINKRNVTFSSAIWNRTVYDYLE